MARNARNIEGFVSRSSNEPRPTLDDVSDNIKPVKTPRKTRSMDADFFAKKKPKPARDLSFVATDVNNDIIESLADLPGYDDISSDESSQVNARALRKSSKKDKKNKPKGKKRPLKIFLIILSVLVLLAVAGFVALKYLWPEKTIDGNFWEVFQKEKLQEDVNGRSNILIFGTEPEGYDGKDLTDSIMLLSLNQTDKTAYMVSLPRDLYTKRDCPNFGTTAGKINEVYACIVDGDYSNETEAAGALQSKVGEVLGLDVHYFVHLNWAGFEQIINAVGGVDVTIESSDSRGIYDISTGVKYANGPVHLDGAAALALARARGSAGGYGLETSNFAREIHQQKIIKAVVEKVVSGSVLTDASQALGLVSALADNLRTNFKASELEALADIGKSISLDNMVSLPLLDAANGINYVTTGYVGDASVVIPTAGTYTYTEIHEYIKKSTSSDPVIREGAVLSVLNGTGEPGLAQIEADKLESKNYTVGHVGNAPDGSYAAIEIYQVNPDKIGTAKALTGVYGVEIQSAVPAGVGTNGVDFVIIVGQVAAE